MHSSHQDPYDFPISPSRSKDRAMAQDTPTKDGDVVTARDKAVDGYKASPVPRTGTPRTGTPRIATPKTGTPAKDDKPVRGTPAASETTEPKSIEKRNGEKPAEQNGEADVAEAPAVTQTPQFRENVEIDDFIGHRVDADNSTVDIQVKWEGGETTWETEWSLQEQVPTLVFKYWDKLDGRENATNLDIYHVFKILKRTLLPGKSKNQQYMYQVQWVGYRRTESTWEHESKLKEIAPGELEKFEAKELLNAAASGQKRKPTRGVGRPRKRARGAAADDD